MHCFCFGRYQCEGCSCTAGSQDAETRGPGKARKIPGVWLIEACGREQAGLPEHRGSQPCSPAICSRHPFVLLRPMRTHLDMDTVIHKRFLLAVVGATGILMSPYQPSHPGWFDSHCLSCPPSAQSSQLVGVHETANPSAALDILARCPR